MTDGRKRMRMKAPHPSRDQAVTVNLSPEDYRAYHELAMHRGVNGADLLRQLIREEFKREGLSHDE